MFVLENLFPKSFSFSKNPKIVFFFSKKEISKEIVSFTTLGFPKNKKQEFSKKKKILFLKLFKKKIFSKKKKCFFKIIKVNVVTFYAL